MSGYYAAGGWVPGTPTPMRLHADECLISAADARAMRLRCSRPDHPTATSDCGRPGARTHEQAEEAGTE